MMRLMPLRVALCLLTLRDILPEITVSAMNISNPAMPGDSTRSKPAFAAASAALYEILYVSTMAANEPLRTVADIAAQSRAANLAGNITGVLVFDGMRFCQHLEGNRKQVLALMERIRQDPRHTQVEVVYHGALYERRFRRFSLGYTTLDDADLLEKIENLDGLVALNAFWDMLTTLDLDA